MKRTLAALCVAALMLGATACDGGAKDSSASKDKGSPASTPSTASSSSASIEPSAPPEPVTYHPLKSDFKLKLKIVSKQCFGSAGCNVEYKIGLAWVGPPSMPKLDHSYDIYFKVNGSDDGGTTGTITVTPGLRYNVYDGYNSVANGGHISVQILRIGKSGGF